MLVMVPMTRARAGRERVPNDLMVNYCTQRASAGLIITEATTISEQGNGWVDSRGIYNDAQVAGWSKINAALHGCSTPVFLPLWCLVHRTGCDPALALWRWPMTKRNLFSNLRARPANVAQQGRFALPFNLAGETRQPEVSGA